MENNFHITPLYFVRNGDININNGRLWYAGLSGRGWSNVALSQRSGTIIPCAYGLGIYDDVIYPSDGPTLRWIILPLRYLT